MEKKKSCSKKCRVTERRRRRKISSSHPQNKEEKDLHRDLLETRFRMDHKEYTSCTFSQYYGAIGYFWRKRRRNNYHADGKVLHLQMQMFKNHTKLYLFFERS